MVDPRLTWTILDAEVRSSRRTREFSYWSFRGWSPDGRYFLYAALETRTSLFLRLLCARHLGDARPEGAAPTFYCYDTRTGSRKRVAFGGTWNSYLGWSDASHIRWLTFDYTTDSVDVVAHDVDVEAGLETDRRIEVPWKTDYPRIDKRRTRLLVIDRERVSDDRTRSTILYLADLDTGAVLSWPCEMEGRYVSASLVSAGHAIVWAWDDYDVTTQPTTQPAETGIRIFDSRLIDVQTGRVISLRGEPRAAFNDFWVTDDRHWLAKRWVHVIRHGLHQKEDMSGLLDLDTGRIISRPDWPGRHYRGFLRWLRPSPGERHWLLLYPHKETRALRVWTLALGSPESALVEHDLTSPADRHVNAPENLWDIAWVDDREIVFLSQQRHLVFYDVVDKKRTRIVTIK